MVSRALGAPPLGASACLPSPVSSLALIDQIMVKSHRPVADSVGDRNSSKIERHVNWAVFPKCPVCPR